MGLHFALLIGLSVIFGAVRPYFPKGISWNGKWPTSSTSAKDAYDMMAKYGDPGFVSLQDVIDIQERKEAVLLDARSAEEFKAGRIPGARNLPYYEFEAYQQAALKDVTETSPVVIYCEGIGCELSFFLGRDLLNMGYKNVRIFYGGYPEWKDAGLRVEK